MRQGTGKLTNHTYSKMSPGGCWAVGQPQDTVEAQFEKWDSQSWFGVSGLVTRLGLPGSQALRHPGAARILWKS